jgi:hypothetical protein
MAAPAAAPQRTFVRHTTGTPGIVRHTENKYPAPCSGRHGDHASMEASESRVAAMCCVVTAKPDDYGIMTETPRCWCRACCPVCGTGAA